MTPESFFGELVPRAWNERLQTEQDGNGASFGLEIRVREPEYEFHLAVKDGEMRAVGEALPDPLITLFLSGADLEQMARTLGPDPLALLTGLGPSDFMLTEPRIEALRELQGSIRLEISGQRPWGLQLCYGGASPGETGTTLSLSQESFDEIRAGETDLPASFFSGKISLEGDMDLAMRMALVLLAG